jgi:uncharacterized caspase-like protein
MFISLRSSLLCSAIALTIACLALARPHAAVAGEGRGYALLIGVNKYNDVKAIKRNENLSYAERDADQLAEALHGVRYTPDSVVTMTTARTRDDPRHPTAAHIRKEVKATAGRLRDGDSVVVSFSGYEMQFAGDDDYYLCPADADADDLHSLISLREVTAALGGAKGKSKLLIIDSCRGLEGSGRGKAPTPRLPTRSVGVLFACSAGQVAYEVPEKRQGVLSYFVGEGLRGAADHDKDETITGEELVSFVKAHVSKYQKDQVPELIGQVPSIEFSPSGADSPTGQPGRCGVVGAIDPHLP